MEASKARRKFFGAVVGVWSRTPKVVNGEIQFLHLLALAMHRFPFLTSDARAGWANLPNIERLTRRFCDSAGATLSI